MSLGSRSCVNWTRRTEQSIDRASAFANFVLPTPGTSSMSRCPSASRTASPTDTVECLPSITRSMLALIRVPASRTWATPEGAEEFTSGPACLAAGWRSSTYASFDFERSGLGGAALSFASSMPTGASSGTSQFDCGGSRPHLPAADHEGAAGSVHRLVSGSPDLDRFLGDLGAGFPRDTREQR